MADLDIWHVPCISCTPGISGKLFLHVNRHSCSHGHGVHFRQGKDSFVLTWKLITSDFTTVQDETHAVMLAGSEPTICFCLSFIVRTPITLTSCISNLAYTAASVFLTDAIRVHKHVSS